jgi:hypothetical protein
MHENWLRYSLDEHARNFVTRWLTIYEKIISELHVHFQSFPLSPCHPFLCPLPLSLSEVLFPYLTSLPCLPSYVPCLTSSFLVSRPLSSVSKSLLLASRLMNPVFRLCSLSCVHCPLSHGSAPSHPSSVTRDLSLVSHPPFFVR